MNRSSPYPYFRRSGPKSAQPTRGITDFLRGNDKMAALLPTVARLNDLQRDCAAVMPAMFDACSVLSFEAGNLVLAVPNAAFTAKLKQQLPKLQDALIKRGWQVNAIRMKIQVRRPEKPKPQKQLVLPQNAFRALANLKESLEDSPANRELKAALDAMLARHRRR